MVRRIAVMATALVAVGGSAHALEFQALGNGSVGVGGAGVARNTGAMAPYWNPAGLAFSQKTVTVSITAGAGLEPEGNLAQDLDNLNKTYKAWNADQTNTANANALVNAIDTLYAAGPKDNLRVTAQAAAGVQIKHFGFGAYGTFEGGAVTNQLAVPAITPTAASIDAALSQKTVSIRGIAVVEVPFSYGYQVDLGKAGKLGVGASTKYLYGEVADRTKSVFDASNNSVLSSKDLAGDVHKSLKGSSSWGIDLGVLWKPVNSLAIGLVGKNLNSPSFSAGDGAKVTVGRQVRAGLSLQPLSWLEVTGDVDVLKNSTIVPGVESQHLGGGLELHPVSSLKLRVGGYTDLAISTKGAVTAGLSVGAPMIYLDVDGAYGLGTTRYNNSKYPSEAKAQASLNLAF